jgi:hypothetical protein
MSKSREGRSSSRTKGGKGAARSATKGNVGECPIYGRRYRTKAEAGPGAKQCGRCKGWHSADQTGGRRR